MVKNLEVFCDGLCEPQPHGIGCCAFVVFRDGEKVYHQYGYIGRGDGMTNNVAEYRAVKAGLLWLEKYAFDEPATLFTDSKLVVEQVNGRWACNASHLIQYRNKCQDLMRHLEVVTLKWVSRERNEVADAYTRVAYREARRRNVNLPFTMVSWLEEWREATVVG